MSPTIRPLLRFCAALLALAVVACSEHQPAGPVAGDHTPPRVVSVQAWDKYHIIVVFDERVTRETADNPLNYHLGAPAQPKTGPRRVLGQGVADMSTASLHQDNLTVTLTTADTLDTFAWSISVHGIADVHGNVMLRTNTLNFEGTNGPDVTPPEIVFQSPEPDAVTASTGGFVRIQFSEAVISGTFTKAFHVTGPGAQRVSIRNDDPIHYDCDLAPLQPNSQYVVSLTGVEDLFHNRMPDVQWTFQTEETADTLAPFVVASSPSANARNVELSAPLTLWFNEPMDLYSVHIRPHVDASEIRWSNGGRKLTLYATWAPNWQYTVQVRPGDMRDLSGNAGTQLFTLVFGTAEWLSPGGFSGTIAGDLSSPGVRDPVGALVFAGPKSPDDLYTSVVAMVGNKKAYEFHHLLNGTYYPFCVVDSNHDGLFQPLYGDAMGIYGINNWWSGEQPQTIHISDNNIIGIDMPMYDPAAVFGLIAYDGIAQGKIVVGLFDTNGFDPMTSFPVISTVAERTGTWDYVVNELDVGPIAAGSYYLAAYMDLNDDGLFEPASEPMGVYGGDTPMAIPISHGVDISDVNLVLRDLGAAVHAASVRWPGAKYPGRTKRLLETIDPASNQLP